MTKGRLEAFSDGVIAIIITIMVLELKVPHGDQVADLWPLTPVLLSYVLSFVYLGIYWNNHHHLLHAARQVDGRILWANLHLLFWLSLVPFVTGWMGENHFASLPVALYGGVLLMAAVSYTLLVRALLGAARQGLGAREGDRQRPQGQPVARRVRARDPGRLQQPLDRVRALRGSRARLARARPAHRARARRRGAGVGPWPPATRTRDRRSMPPRRARCRRATTPTRSFFAASSTAIHHDMWLHAGRTEALDAPGRYFLVRFAGVNLIVLRDEQGGVAAFHNTCRHRGTLLCREDAGRLAGSIQCPYHAWTYGLDGALRSRAAHGEGRRTSDLREHGLGRVAAAEWDGHVFVNLSAPPGPAFGAPGRSRPQVPRRGAWASCAGPSAASTT